MAPIQRLDISPFSTALASFGVVGEPGGFESSEMHQKSQPEPGALRQNLVTRLACALLQRPAEMPISGGYAGGDAS